MSAQPYSCGNCGQPFATKGEKKRHKTLCRADAPDRHEQDERTDDADLYGHVRISPEIKARAAAEWAAMDWRGRLPAGWEYRP